MVKMAELHATQQPEPVPVTLTGGAISRIHVNKHIIAANQKHGQEEPVFTVKNRGMTHRASEVFFKSGTLVYRPDRPLGCGAVAWIETREEVVMIP